MISVKLSNDVNAAVVTTSELSDSDIVALVYTIEDTEN